MIWDYSWSKARKDLIAGATVAAISLPQGMAYALIAGVDPRFGLYSAIVVTAVASIFGSSSQLINGPTNAISLVVFSALAFLDPEARFDAYQAMFLLGVMVGVIQILIAVFKLGDLTRYISESVVIGFMAGAGFLVALGQVGNLLGIKERGTGDQHVLLRFWLTVSRGGTPSQYAVVIGVGVIVLAVALRKVVRRYHLPQLDMLLALIVMAWLAAHFGWSVPAAGGKTLMPVVGAVPASLPRPHIPQIQFWWVRQMATGSLAIALLGLVEALAIAKSIAIDTRQVLDYNRQCMAEGLANLAGGFFQSLPGSGSLTRSAINHQSGAVSRFSGVVAAATVAVVVLLMAPLARFVPKAALAGLLIITAVRLVDWHRLRYAVRASRYDAILVMATAFSAIFIGVETAIFIGVALSILLFVPRAARLRGTELVVTKERVVRERAAEDPICSAIILYDLEGEVFFGAGSEIDRCFDWLRKRASSENVPCVILRVKRSRNPDMVFIERLERFLHDMQHEGRTVLLCGVRAEMAHAMTSAGFGAWLPESSVFLEEQKLYSATLKAVRHAFELVKDTTCVHCAERRNCEGDGDGSLYYLV